MHTRQHTQNTHTRGTQLICARIPQCVPQFILTMHAASSAATAPGNSQHNVQPLDRKHAAKHSAKCKEGWSTYKNTLISQSKRKVRNGLRYIHYENTHEHGR